MMPPCAPPAGVIHQPAGLAHREGLRGFVRFAPRDEPRRPRRQLAHALHGIGARQGRPRPLQHALDRPALYGRAHPGILPAMGRIFEVRKHTMFARWNRMAKQFARIGKDITIAVKAGRPRPEQQPGAAPRDPERARDQHAEGQGRGRDQARLRPGRDRFPAGPLRGLCAARRRACWSRPRPTTRRARSRACATSCRSTAATSRATAASASCSGAWASSA